MTVRYRPEIDGLRAVSVLLVILYHAAMPFFGRHGFKGGFIGVDIFFVISGYLITGNILRDLTDHKFSLLTFYEKRTRRIIPALFLVTCSTLPIGWYLMFPADFKAYLGSLASSTLSLSNIFFALEDRYAAESGLFKPLLHTWSLSVEEQFYLFFPALLLIVWKFARARLMLTLSLLFVISLSIAQYGTVAFPSISFFILPTRIWELMAGALLAKLELDQGRLKQFAWSAYLPGLGLIMILASVGLFRETTPHPSFYTLIPVLGAMLIIWFGGFQDSCSKILSSKPFVSLGLISYSLYLWHQPIFVFMRLSSFKVLNVGDKLLMIAVSIAVAFISWKYIELPFRKRSFIGRSKLWIATAVIALLLLCMSLFGYYKEGFPERMGPLALRTYNEMQTIEFARLTQNGRVCRSRQPSEACAFGDQSWVTIGDSTVGVLEPTLQKALEQNNLGLIAMNFDQCLLGNNMWFGNETRCPQINEERWKVIEKWSDKKTVVISHRGWFFSDAKEAGSTQRIPEKSVIEHIDQNITKLLEKGHRVILVYPVPDPGFELKPLLASVVMRQKEGKLLRKFSSVESAYEDAMSYSRISTRSQTIQALYESIQLISSVQTKVLVADANVLSSVRTGPITIAENICLDLQQVW